MSHEQRILIRRRQPCGGALRRTRSRTGGGWAVLTILLTAVCWGTVSGVAQTAAPADSGDSGVFQILSDNSRVGTETFQIKRTAEGWESTADLSLEGPKGAKVSETSTLLLDAQLHPVRYERVQKTPVPGNLVAQFGAIDTQLVAVVNGGDPQQEDFEMPLDNLAVLDTNFFHHYAFLLRLYDRNKGGAQPFNVFVPQEALPGTISLKFLGNEKVTVGHTAEDLDHFQAVTEELQIDIWARPDGALQRISIPSAKLEVVRQ